jgi:hypothetical protein
LPNTASQFSFLTLKSSACPALAFNGRTHESTTHAGLHINRMPHGLIWVYTLWNNDRVRSLCWGRQWDNLNQNKQIKRTIAVLASQPTAPCKNPNCIATGMHNIANCDAIRVISSPGTGLEKMGLKIGFYPLISGDRFRSISSPTPTFSLVKTRPTTPKSEIVSRISRRRVVKPRFYLYRNLLAITRCRARTRSK